MEMTIETDIFQKKREDFNSSFKNFCSILKTFFQNNIGILLIIAIAATFRLLFLGQSPPANFFDEISPWTGTLYIILHSSFFSPRSTGFAGSQILIQSKISASIYGLYESIYLLGPSAFSARLPGSIYGIALIPATYLLTTFLFGKKVGLWASLLVAISPLAIFSSRVFYSQQAMDGIAIAVFATWAILSGLLGNKVKKLRTFAGYFLFSLNIGGFLNTKLVFPSLVILIAITFMIFLRPKSEIFKKKLYLYATSLPIVFIYLMEFIIPMLNGISPSVPTANADTSTGADKNQARSRKFFDLSPLCFKKATIVKINPK